MGLCLLLIVIFVFLLFLKLCLGDIMLIILICLLSRVFIKCMYFFVFFELGIIVF